MAGGAVGGVHEEHVNLHAPQRRVQGHGLLPAHVPRVKNDLRHKLISAAPTAG